MQSKKIGLRRLIAGENISEISEVKYPALISEPIQVEKTLIPEIEIKQVPKMAKFRNTLVGKFIRKSPIAKIVNKGLSAVTGGILGNGLIYDALKDTGKNGSKSTVPSSPSRSILTETANELTDLQTINKNETMIEKIKVFAVENWKFLVPAVVIAPVAIWFFFFRNKRKVSYRR